MTDTTRPADLRWRRRRLRRRLPEARRASLRACERSPPPTATQRRARESADRREADEVGEA